MYLQYWVGTEVQYIIQSKIVNITVGGTSAGLAILGNWIFSAINGTVTSPEALSVSLFSFYLGKINFILESV